MFLPHAQDFHSPRITVLQACVIQFLPTFLRHCTWNLAFLMLNAFKKVAWHSCTSNSSWALLSFTSKIWLRFYFKSGKIMLARPRNFKMSGLLIILRTIFQLKRHVFFNIDVSLDFHGLNSLEFNPFNFFRFLCLWLVSISLCMSMEVRI